jgi:hypothetical protein
MQCFWWISLNGLSSTRGGRRKALTRSPGSSEPGRRPRSRGRRAETHKTRGSAGRTVGGGSLNRQNQRLSHVPSTSHMPCGYTPMHTRKGPTPLHIRYSVCSSQRGLAVSPGMVWAWREHSDAQTGIRWIQNMLHGHELVYMLRVLLWDTLGASVGISTCTPYCSTVCLCLNNSLTHTYIVRSRSELYYCIVFFF